MAVEVCHIEANQERSKGWLTQGYPLPSKACSWGFFMC